MVNINCKIDKCYNNIDGECNLKEINLHVVKNNLKCNQLYTDEDLEEYNKYRRHFGEPEIKRSELTNK